MWEACKVSCAYVSLPLLSRDGRSRQLGFVGFRTSAEAEAAVRFFNKSFLDTSRLSVEPARRVNDTPGAEQERPWSKYSKGEHTWITDI